MGWAAHAPEWVTIALLSGAFLFARRFGGGAALAELERANRILETAVTKLRIDNDQLTAEVALLRTTRDVSLVIQPVLAALALHEERAAERIDRTLDVLDLIAVRIGPE